MARLGTINDFLLGNGLRITDNPCVSPDYCLAWRSLSVNLDQAIVHHKSRFEIAAGIVHLVEDAGTGDCAWRLKAEDRTLPIVSGLIHKNGFWWFPATWDNLLALKNLVQEHDPESTIFPTASRELGIRSIGVGARFTTLHWPAVDWVMSKLNLGLTANQNSIPRELVYDVDAMLAGHLRGVPFPFIGCDVPEGHQGQSVQGMSHGCVIEKLRNGFHRRRIAWGFNADHQPVGGSSEEREDALVEGCLLASYITFDLSPELALNRTTPIEECDARILRAVRSRLAEASIEIGDLGFQALIERVWASVVKMKRRDMKYEVARARSFTTDIGRAFHRELSIDELPGITAPETTAVMLALCECFGMPIHYLAPAFGMQKNLPFQDNDKLARIVQSQWDVCRQFGVSIGVHSGSGKSAENYRTLGFITDRHLEIKTSGRYTYELGRALEASRDPEDQRLWRDWYRFTLDLAIAGAYSAIPEEAASAQEFIGQTLAANGLPVRLVSEEETRLALESLRPSAESIFFLEYNFLYVLAGGGLAMKSALGDHSAEGYRQRARFYRISKDTRLAFAANIASYLLFLAEETGIAETACCEAARKELLSINTLDEFLDSIDSTPIGSELHEMLSR